MHSWSHVLLGDWRGALDAVVKVVALFLTAAVALRFTERRTLAEFAPFDWAAAVACGAIIGRTATAPDSSWLVGAAAVVALLAAHSAVSWARFLPLFARWFDPPLRVLIKDGRVDRRQLRRCRMTDADLEEVLRQHGHAGPDDVHLAVFETKGTVSVLGGRS
jgi:uncharacterized membrane protein YcaP (DUF421 family)